MKPELEFRVLAFLVSMAKRCKDCCCQGVTCMKCDSTCAKTLVADIKRPDPVERTKTGRQTGGKHSSTLIGTGTMTAVVGFLVAFKEKNFSTLQIQERIHKKRQSVIWAIANLHKRGIIWTPEGLKKRGTPNLWTVTENGLKEWEKMQNSEDRIQKTE